MRALYFYHEIEEQFEDMLNDSYEEVNICDYKYESGRALRLIDETAFRCGCSDWISEEFEEIGIESMTAEEIAHYIVSAHQVMYCHVDEVDCDE